MPSAILDMQIEAFFDRATCTVTYVVVEPEGSHCAVIDPVLDFDPRAGMVSTASLQQVAARIRERELRLEWILETHCHADHLSGAFELKQMLGGRIGIGRGITAAQRSFGELLHLHATLQCDGSQFDRLFDDGDTFALGEATVRVIATPGHTPACVSYLLGDAVFVGDTLFMPDVGSARCDFPGGDAATLYRSIRRLLRLPPATRLFVGHDYPPSSREVAWESSVALQRERNVHIGAEVPEAEFVATRRARDRALAPPALMWPALQINIRGGRLPPAESNGLAYLKLPIGFEPTKERAV